MKYIYFAIAILCSTAAFAQDTKETTTVVRKTMTMSGAEANRMFSNVTDKKIYQRDGTIVDSVKAAAMVKSFEYGLGYATPEGQTEMKRVLMKINPKHELELYQRIKTDTRMQLKSAKLQDGLTLDLKPLAKSVDTTKLAGKAIIMIFWCPGCYNGSRHDEYHEINDIISTYYNPDKLQVIAITNSPFDVAADELKKSPILNARNVFEGSHVTDDYQTENRPVIIMTDKAHKILFSVKNNTGVTNWMLNKLLKENM
jgi:hypothetical protein